MQARWLRKTLGGGMRQIGVLCAAALVALRENVAKLEDDHKNAKILAGDPPDFRLILNRKLRFYCESINRWFYGFLHYQKD